jgi:hypothetical protein
MLLHPHSANFIVGEHKELAVFEKMKVFDLVDLPPGKHVMASGWIYAVKTDLQGDTVWKSRFVAKGYSQVQGIDYFEVFSPTMQIKSLRTLLALHSGNAAVLSESWDVSAAFLFADIHEELYVKQPQGHVDPLNKTKVWRLRKALYGIKQAARAWEKTMNAGMVAVGFVQSKNDACLYIMNVGKSFIHAVVHIDDFCLFHNDTKLLTKTFNALNTKYILKRGALEHFLGMRVMRDHTHMTYTLDQEDYAVSILKRFGMYDCRTVVCPETQHKLSKNQSPPNAQEETEMRDMPYSELVGCIQYLVVCTRPDLAHCCSQVSRFMQNPGKAHWTATLRILRYLRGRQITSSTFQDHPKLRP